ncbi:ATP-binding protein, partial [Phaeospirillum tilakii]
AAARPDRRAGGGPAPPPGQPRPKLLIVDDQPANLIALKHLLAKVDAEVIPAASGNEALKLTLNHDFALALLDVQMPEIDGFEVAELLRGEERTRDLPIIFLTAAHRDADHRSRGYGAGAVDYIEKPIDEPVLLAKVRVFLDLYRGQAERDRLLRLLTEANRSLNQEIEARRRREADDQRLAGTILDAVAEAILVCDAAVRITAVNPAFTRITGFTPQEVQGRTLALLGSGRQGQDFYAAMWEDLRQQGRWQGEVWNRRKSGEIYPVWLSAVTVRGADGAVEKVVGVFSDITRRKQVERDLLGARVAAERANRAKSAFLANLSHEFRAPLNAILGLSELLLIEGETAAAAARRDYAANIHDHGRHLLELVNDLLDLSKIEAGKWPLHPGLFPLRPLVEECVRLMQVEAGGGGIAIAAALESAPAVLMADQRAVRQCLFALLSNAIRYSPAGGTVTLEVAAEGTMTRFQVIDRGAGIPAEAIPRLLNPFDPDDEPAARSGPGGAGPGGGTGLGLAVVRSLVDLHGGRMRIDSGEGAGTTVTLLLPTGGVAPPA